MCWPLLPRVFTGNIQNILVCKAAQVSFASTWGASNAIAVLQSQLLKEHCDLFVGPFTESQKARETITDCITAPLVVLKFIPHAWLGLADGGWRLQLTDLMQHCVQACQQSVLALQKGFQQKVLQFI